MARFGVTYHDIANAANQLVGQGKQPTIEMIRHLLGTGSSTTIANHLRKWRAEQEKDTSLLANEKIPQELMAVIKGLWERVAQHANEKIMAMESQFLQAVKEAQEECNTIKQAYHQLQQQFEQLKQEKISLSTDHQALQQAFTNEVKEHTTLKSQNEGAIKQLQEKQERINELNRLHVQMQANLEHYRESAREQRLLDQHQYEEQKQILHAQIKESQAQLAAMSDKNTALQHQHQQIKQHHAILQHTHDQLISRHDILQDKFEKIEQEKNRYAQAIEHWQKRLEELQKQTELQQTKMVELQVEMKILTQQLKSAHDEIGKLTEENKLLIHEKWILAQEKAHLVGQLKQLEVKESA